MCMNHYQAKTLLGDTQPVPCGKCPECVKRHISQWSFRLTEQEKASDSAYFLTLTYGTDSVRITRAGFLTLDKRDIQLFLKRVRKSHYTAAKQSHSGTPIIKYFLVGEYGGKSYRPHYHVLIFNSQLDVLFDKQQLLALKYDDYSGKLPVTCSQWPYGHVTVGKVSGASVGYTLKYIEKPKRIPMHRNDDRLPEFRLMSKKLGEAYLTPEMKKWHLNDPLERMYVERDGKKISMPRYYKDRIYDETQRLLAGAHQRKTMLEKQAKLIEKDPDFDRNVEEKKHQEYKKMYRNSSTGRDAI